MAKSRPAASTPATAALTSAGIAFTLHPYEHDDTESHFGDEAAAKLGVPAERIFKTLVLDTGAGLAVAVVPVAGRLDPKAAAHALEVKRVALAEARAAARSTGYVVGGISPLGQKHSLPTVVDESAGSYDLIMVSAGRRGLQVELAPQDLLRMTAGRYAPLSRP